MPRLITRLNKTVKPNFKLQALVIGLRPLRSNCCENDGGRISESHKKGNCHFGSRDAAVVGGVIDNRDCGVCPLILELGIVQLELELDRLISPESGSAFKDTTPQGGAGFVSCGAVKDYPMVFASGPPAAS
jgi:hypothetical protein